MRKLFLFLMAFCSVFFLSNSLTAQTDGFFRSYDDYTDRDTGITGNDITNNNFGAPVGSGLLIMVGAGVTYIAVRRKRISKRRTTTLLLALLMLLGMTQCKKKLDTINPVAGNTYNISLSVDNDSKVIVTPHSNYATVRFESGDVIHVAYNKKYAGSLTHNGTNFTGNITITETSEQITTINQPLYFYFMGNKPLRNATPTTTISVDISNQTGGLPVISMAASDQVFSGTGSYTAALDNKCALVKFNTPNVDELVRITGLNNIIQFDLTKADKTAVPASMQGISSWAATTDSIIDLYKESNTVRWAILIPRGETKIAAKTTGYLSKKGIIVPATTPSAYLSDGININLTQAPEMAFSTSVDNTYIYFAKGNLQCKRKKTDWSEYEWSFKTNQYDIDYSENYTVGENYANEDVVGHFGWGASGYNINASSTIDPLALNYKPNSTYGTYNHAALTDSVNPYRYGPSWTDNPFDDHGAGVNITGTNFDWGVYNSYGGASGLGIGGGGTDSWRLFTRDEIVYILGPNGSPKPGINCRLSSTVGNVKNARFVKVRLSDASNGSGTGLNGLIIFPDVYEHPGTVQIPSNINNMSCNFTTNSYTKDEWALMEEAGAAFLPAAGCHEKKKSNNDGYIHDINSYCYYWTSNCQIYTEDPNHPEKTENPATSAKNLRVGTKDMVTDSRSYRARGSSVRLVRDAITTPPTPTSGE